MINVNDTGIKVKNDKSLLYFTIPIVILMLTCSSIGILNQTLYSKQALDWLLQTIGQDISNIFCVAPILLISAFFASNGNKNAKIIWIGTMITNIYSYVIYCFAVYFNCLFHVYCLILGLSIYSAINFFIKNVNEDFKSWFTEKVPTKIIGIFILILAFVFSIMWLSDSLPGALTNTVPESIIKDDLITNPVQALDFSFYIPLMFISSFMVIKKKAFGYLLAPMMLVFGGLTAINIISLMVVTMQKTGSNNVPQIIIFSILACVCICFLYLFLKNISDSSQNTKCLK